MNNGSPLIRSHDFTGSDLFSTSWILVFFPSVKLVIYLDQDHPILIFHWYALDNLTEQSRGVVDLHIPISGCFLFLRASFIESIVLVSCTSCLSLWWSSCNLWLCSQTVHALEASSFAFSWAHASAWQLSCFITYPCLPFSFGLPYDFLICKYVHFFDLALLLLHIRLHLLFII